MSLRKIYARAYQWLPFLMGLVFFFAARILQYFPETTDQLYRNGMFRAYRWFHDNTLGYMPFAVVYVVIAVVLGTLIYQWSNRALFFYRPWYRGIANFIGITVIWFYISWGFNYSAPGVIDKLGFEKGALNGRMHNELFDLSIRSALNHRDDSDTTEFYSTEIKSLDQLIIHIEVRDFLNEVGFKTPGNARLRRISRNGWMRRMGVSGIYFPFSGEAHADASYPALKQWFIIAHEYAHAYGVTDEGECNFVAFMALVRSENPKLQYAAWFELIGDLINEELKGKTPSALLSDRQEMRRNAEQYPPLIPRLAAHSNNLYLKLNGVEDGIESYYHTATFVQMAIDNGLLSVNIRK